MLDLSYQERVYLIECIQEKQKATKKAIDDMSAQKNSNRQRR